MLERLTFLLPVRLLMIGTGITWLSIVDIRSSEFNCIKTNQEKNYCKLVSTGLYWSEDIQEFNLKSVAIDSAKFVSVKCDIYNDNCSNVDAYNHSLIFNTETKIKITDRETFLDLQEPEKIKRKVDYFLDNKSEKILIVKDPDLGLANRIFNSISSWLLIFMGLFLADNE